MNITVKRIAIAVAVALYLYLLLPATATAFYELYHVVELDFIYWAYSGFKVGAYYFGQWAYKWAVCLGVALLILFLPAVFSRRGV